MNSAWSMRLFQHGDFGEALFVRAAVTHGAGQLFSISPSG